MSYRTEEIKAFKTLVICDDCGKETPLRTMDFPLNFNERMNGALSKGYSFTDTGGQFKNFCKECKPKHK